MHFESSAAGELLERLHEVDTAPTPEEQLQFFVKLLQWFYEEIQPKLKDPRVSQLFRDALVGLFFLIASLPVSAWWNAPSEQQHRIEVHLGFDRLEAQVATLDRKLDEMQQDIDQIKGHLGTLSNQILAYRAKVDAHPERPPLYRAIKEVIVRDEPSSKAERLLLLYPGADMQEIDRDGQWLNIKYFDYIDWEERTGWVYNRNLILVESSGDN